MRGYDRIIAAVGALLGLLVCQTALARDVRTERFYVSDDFLFFEQPAAGDPVVRFVPRATTELTYLYTVPTSGGRMAKVWRLAIGLDFADVESAKAEARAAISAWLGIPIVRNVVTTAGCRFLLEHVDVTVVTPPPAGPYDVLGDQVCVMEVATRSSAGEAALMAASTEGDLVNIGVAPYRVVVDVEIRADMMVAHQKLAQHRQALAGLSADTAFFMTGYAVAEQLDGAFLSLSAEELEPVFDSMFQALFQHQPGEEDSYSLRAASSVPWEELDTQRVVAEFSLL